MTTFEEQFTVIKTIYENGEITYSLKESPSFYPMERWDKEIEIEVISKSKVKEAMEFNNISEEDVK